MTTADCMPTAVLMDDWCKNFYSQIDAIADTIRGNHFLYRILSSAT